MNLMRLAPDSKILYDRLVLRLRWCVIPEQPSFRRLECGEKEVKIWSSVSSLQVCFDWDCLNPCGDIGELSDSVSSYISLCVDSQPKRLLSIQIINLG